VQLKREYNRERMRRWATLASYSLTRRIVNAFVCSVAFTEQRQSAGGGWGV